MLPAWLLVSATCATPKIGNTGKRGNKRVDLLPQRILPEHFRKCLTATWALKIPKSFSKARRAGIGDLRSRRGNVRLCNLGRRRRLPGYRIDMRSNSRRGRGCHHRGDGVVSRCSAFRPGLLRQRDILLSPRQPSFVTTMENGRTV